MALYLFTGDEWLRERAVERLKRELFGKDPSAWSETQLDGEDFRVARFVEALQSPSLFADGVLIHVKRIEKLGEPLDLLPQLGRAHTLRTHIIFEGEKLDKRGKFYKKIAETAKVQDYTHPNRRDLPTVAAQLLKEYGVKLSGQGFRYLLENVEGDLSRIGREAEKLNLYAHGREISQEELRGILFHDKEGDLFAALDALMERRPSAIRGIEAIVEGGEEAGKLFFILAGQIRSLLKIQALAEQKMSSQEIAAKTGDFSWLVAKRIKTAQGIPRERLISFLHRLHQEDVRIKRGERQPEESLWSLVLEWIYPDARTAAQQPEDYALLLAR
ncbi:DNA polymerase III subunit delta [Candidatus Acetothermia bacterium]|nr:DNA polymerase III subunit delta [Candidatus Acetothermia bacterium]MBI3643816.1 DNA polymerase III subunit delta [Candidatus Acetothermia bacterium]